MDGYLEIVIGAKDPAAEVATGIRLVNGRLHPPGRLRILPADVDEGVMNLIRDSGDDDSFDHLVGIALEQLAILEGPGLRLVCVDHEIGRPGRGKEAPLEARRECRPSPTQQTGGLYGVDQLVSCHAHGSTRLDISARVLVDIDPVGVGWVIDHPPGDYECRAHSPTSVPTVPRGWNAG